MAIKLNEQIIIIILLIAVLALFAVSFNLYSTARELIRSEQDIASKMESISSGINTLSQRLQEANSWVGNQRSELDKAINELTMERIKNAQLQKEIAELKAKASTSPSASAGPKAVTP